MKFRLVDTGYNNAFMNMAIDEALLGSKLPVLRFYKWKPAGLSIGYFQSVKDFNLDNLRKHTIELVRRLTGGNAVLHDKELTYSFVIDEGKMPKSVVEGYKKISTGLLQGLRNLGLKAVMNEMVEKGKKSAVCFNDPSWYDIIVNGKKLIGSAQKRINGKLLQHGAVLIGIDVERYCSLFNNCNGELINRVRGRITSINDEIKGKVCYDDVEEAMRRGFEKGLGIEFEESELTKNELGIAKELERNKYSTDKWNRVR